MSEKLFKEFKKNSSREWQDKIVSDLKGKDFNETLVWNSEIGEINPVLFSYTAKDNENSTIDYSAESNTWNIRQSFDAKDEEVNSHIMEALKSGVNSINIRNASYSTLKRIFNNVMLDIIEASIEVNSKNQKSIIDSYKEICTGYDKSYMSGGIIYDPIKNLIKKGNWRIGQDEDLHALIDILEALEDFDRIAAIHVDASVYGNAGANVDQQIAYALAHGNEYLNYLDQNNISVKDNINRISFNFSVGTSYFLEIAKIRAFKVLWSTLIQQYGVNENPNIKITAVSSNLYYSNKDQYNNLLRATTAGMSAAIAGYESIELLPYNINSNGKDIFANRIAKNIQLLLQEEAYLNKVMDPSNGSYYVEEITNKIKERAWEQFKNIEQNGGLISSLEKGLIQNEIAQSMEGKLDSMRNEKSVMIGVNKFINADEEKLPQKQENDSEELDTLIKPILSQRLSSEFE